MGQAPENYLGMDGLELAHGRASFQSVVESPGRDRLEAEVAVDRAAMGEGVLEAGTTNGRALESEEHELGIWSGNLARKQLDLVRLMMS